MISQFNYLQALYRKDNYGRPCVWYITSILGGYKIVHGILGKTLLESFTSSNNIITEINAKIKDKRKFGYKYLNEVKDNATLPVEEIGPLFSFLNKYLPNIRTTADGSISPMLAKAYDNTNNKVFKHTDWYYGQWKINGERCLVSAYWDNSGLFPDIKFKFQSREGTIWNNLEHIEDALKYYLREDFINKMIDDNIVLDGELYIPGMPLGDINSAIKNSNNPYHTKVQYWIYDLAIDEYTQEERFNILYSIPCIISYPSSREIHLNNTNIINVVPCTIISDDEDAIKARDIFIDYGFEGLILRNPESCYEFGSRKAGVMIKFKRHTDGVFTIVDIYPEGTKRNDLPLFKCKNDINDETFECKISESLEEQKKYLINREDYIGKELFIEYGERSSVAKVPFHIKHVRFKK